MSRATRCGLLLAAATLGCVTAPLGDDWEQLPPAARDLRAVDALSDVFAGRVDGAGAPVPDREVLLADLEGISYESQAGTSHLRWLDVEAVEQDDHPELPARPVDLRLYLRRESWSEDSVKDVVEPSLVKTGLFRRYVLLRMRPRGARSKLTLALDHLRSRAGAEVPAGAPRATTAPVGSATPPVAEGPAPAPAVGPAAPSVEDPLEETEAKLRRLKAWRDEGLISDEEYEAKRKALLEGL